MGVDSVLPWGPSIPEKPMAKNMDKCSQCVGLMKRAWRPLEGEKPFLSSGRNWHQYQGFLSAREKPVPPRAKCPGLQEVLADHRENTLDRMEWNEAGEPEPRGRHTARGQPSPSKACGGPTPSTTKGSMEKGSLPRSPPTVLQSALQGVLFLLREGESPLTPPGYLPAGNSATCCEKLAAGLGGCRGHLGLWPPG